MALRINLKRTSTDIFRDMLQVKRRGSSHNSDSSKGNSSRREASQFNVVDKMKFKLTTRNSVIYQTSPFTPQEIDTRLNLNLKPSEKRDEEQVLLRHMSSINLDEKVFQLDDDLDVKLFIFLITKGLKKNNEMAALSRFFLDFNFFQGLIKKLPTKSYNNLIKKLKYEFIPKHSVIFSKGEPGKKFYIILKGKVGLLQTKDGLSPEHKKTSASPVRRKSFFGQKNDEKPAHNSMKDSRENEEARQTTGDDLTPNVRKNSEKNMLSVPKHSSPQASSFSFAINPIQITGSGSNNALSIPMININPAISRQRTPYSIFNSKENTPKMMNSIDLDEFEEFIKSKFPSSFKSKSFGPGTAFGELGLMDGAKRTATVVTEEDTHFVVLNKEDYDDTLGQYHQQMYHERIEFLKSLIYFHEWNLTKLSSVLMITEIKNFQKNNIIYEEGDQPDYLYFIKEGEIEILEKISWKEQTSVKETLKIVKNAVESRPSLLKAKSTRKPISRLVPGNVFGEEEIIDDIPRINTAVVVSSHVELYCIPKEKFNYFLRRSTACTKLLEQLETKKQYREKYKTNLTETAKHQNENALPVNNTLELISPELTNINTRYMNKAKNEPGHIPKTFLPTTLPIPEFEDDNIFSKTPSAMMSPIHSEKSPKPGMDKTPKGRFIELTTPTPIKPGSKEREHENPKLSISINFRPMAGSTMPGSPMLSPIAAEKQPYIMSKTRPTTAKNASMIVVSSSKASKQTLLEAKKEIEKIKFFPREPPKPRTPLVAKPIRPKSMHISVLQSTLGEDTLKSPTAPKPHSPKYQLGRMLKSRPMTAASSISVAVPKRAINSLLFDEKDLEVLNMIGNASTLNRYMMFFVNNDEESREQQSRPQTAKKEFVNIHVERQKEQKAKRKSLKSASFKSASSAKIVKPLVNGFPFGGVVSVGRFGV